MSSLDVHTIEQFYGVYLLYCTNPKYVGRTYIGFTTDPNRRIKQHNKGKKAGGAWKTSNRGPWVMVMIIHGFPNEIAALRFEWAWQHPLRSRRLNHVPRKKVKEKTYDYCLRVLWEMLRVGPWNRLPLTVRWLDQSFAKEFPIDRAPPVHVPICYGPVVSKKLALSQETTEVSTKNCNSDICCICDNVIIGKKLTCLKRNCDLVSHVICLSNFYLELGEYVPIEGKCPRCKNTFLWGDIVRKYKGCYSSLECNINLDVDSDFYCSDSE